MRTSPFRDQLLAAVAAVALLIAGCDSFLDVDRDPTSAEAVPGGMLFVHAIANYGSNRTVEIGFGQLFAAQAWASGLSTGVFITAERYQISPFTVGNTWKNYYGHGIKNLRMLIEQAEAHQPPLRNEAAQARLLAAHVFYSLTTIWEDIPFRDVLDTAPTAPRFDAQRDVLYGVVDLIDEALEQIDDSPPMIMHDVIYYGDMAAWRRFGNSVKLKALMLLKSGGENVDAQIGALLENTHLIRRAGDNAYIPFSIGNPNPRFVLPTLFGSNWVWTYGAEALVDRMNALEDPRRPIYLHPNANGEFVGVTPGTSGAGRSLVHGRRSWGTPHAIEGNMIHPEMPDPLLTADEILFLEADFLAQAGQLAAADERYREGIRQNFQMWAEITPADVPDPEEYLATLPPLTALSLADARTAIHEQHFIALFIRGPEAWTHMRRVGEIATIERTLPVGAVLTNFMTRYYYPQEERDANPHVPPPPRLDQPMWFQENK